VHEQEGCEKQRHVTSIVSS